MLSNETLLAALPHALTGVDLPALGTLQRGKVRDSYQRESERILITTDRVSAFDRVLGLIPYKGQVLNQLSAWWFAQTAHIIPNHLRSLPDPNVLVAANAQPLPVEVVVRGYITGVTSTSLWTLYEKGERTPYGVALPDGLKKNDALPRPIITPTTKAQDGGHDEIITPAEILARGLVAPDLWQEVETAALALFAEGQRLAQAGGLILVDTKYEFGMVDGQLTLIDEVHTPDSSRFWETTAYQDGKPESLSKEFLREWFAQQGYKGEGTPPTMPAEFVVQVAQRYIRIYEQLTTQAFVPAPLPAQDRIAHTLSPYYT